MGIGPAFRQGFLFLHSIFCVALAEAIVVINFKSKGYCPICLANIFSSLLPHIRVNFIIQNLTGGGNFFVGIG